MNLAQYLSAPSPMEKELRAFLSPTQPLTILDIGACEGEDSIRYKIMYPTAAIYSFEPLQGNIEKMKRNFASYGLQDQINVVDCALSDSEGWADFHVSSGAPRGKNNTSDWDYGNKSSSLLEPATDLLERYKWLNFDSKVKVRTMRLADFCHERNIDRIDLIHMDVQGAELMVLKGAGEWLRKTVMVWLEVENVELYKSQPLKRDIEKYMRGANFIKVKDTVSAVAGDQCYVNSSQVGFFKVYSHRVAHYLSFWKKIFHSL